jgi:hypothetical protein
MKEMEEFLKKSFKFNPNKDTLLSIIANID